MAKAKSSKSVKAKKKSSKIQPVDIAMAAYVTSLANQRNELAELLKAARRHVDSVVLRGKIDEFLQRHKL